MELQISNKFNTSMFEATKIYLCNNRLMQDPNKCLNLEVSSYEIVSPKSTSHF